MAQQAPKIGYDLGVQNSGPPILAVQPLQTKAWRGFRGFGLDSLIRHHLFETPQSLTGLRRFALRRSSPQSGEPPKPLRDGNGEHGLA